MPETTRAVRWFEIPPGTKSTLCNGSTCGRRFYWVRGADGKARPISADVEGGKAPSEVKDEGQLDLLGGEALVFSGRGVLHGPLCENAAEFARGGR